MPGELLTSYAEMSEAIAWKENRSVVEPSIQSTRWSVQSLVKLDTIKTEPRQGKLLIKVLHWDDYQGQLDTIHNSPIQQNEPQQGPQQPYTANHNRGEKEESPANDTLFDDKSDYPQQPYTANHNRNHDTTGVAILDIKKLRSKHMCMSGLHIDSGDFDKFWSLYPRKIGKKRASDIFKRALKTTSAETIIAGLESQLPQWEKADKRFIPHASTWLNGERWEDEVGSATIDDDAPSPYSDITVPEGY